MTQSDDLAPEFAALAVKRLRQAGREHQGLDGQA
jgi:hypothetical protein